jgi:hypothetical protein
MKTESPAASCHPRLVVMFASPTPRDRRVREVRLDEDALRRRRRRERRRASGRRDRRRRRQGERGPAGIGSAEASVELAGAPHGGDHLHEDPVADREQRDDGDSAPRHVDGRAFLLPVVVGRCRRGPHLDGRARAVLEGEEERRRVRAHLVRARRPNARGRGRRRVRVVLGNDRRDRHIPEAHRDVSSFFARALAARAACRSSSTAIERSRLEPLMWRQCLMPTSRR